MTSPRIAHRALSILAAFAFLGVSDCATFPVSATVPDGLGINTHFAGAPARDLNLLGATGGRIVRTDLVWAAVERQKGVYDFRPYDEPTDALVERGIRPMYLLDYGNPLYGEAMSVTTAAGRKAFARFAAAAAAPYRGKGVIWEL